MTTQADKATKFPSQTLHSTSAQVHPHTHTQPTHDHTNTSPHPHTVINTNNHNIKNLQKAIQTEANSKIKKKKHQLITGMIIIQSSHVQQWAVLVTHSSEFWQGKFV